MPFAIPKRCRFHRTYDDPTQVRINEQSEQMQKLREIVRGTEQFRRPFGRSHIVFSQRGLLCGGSLLVTPAALRLDPMFDPLRNYPRFQKLAPSETPTR